MTRCVVLQRLIVLITCNCDSNDGVLMQLAVTSKAQLRERSFSLPAASDDLMHKFYPVLAHAMILADVNAVADDEGPEAWGKPLLTCTMSYTSNTLFTFTTHSVPHSNPKICAVKSVPSNIKVRSRDVISSLTYHPCDLNAILIVYSIPSSYTSLLGAEPTQPGVENTLEMCLMSMAINILLHLQFHTRKERTCYRGAYVPNITVLQY